MKNQMRRAVLSLYVEGHLDEKEALNLNLCAKEGQEVADMLRKAKNYV